MVYVKPCTMDGPKRRITKPAVSLDAEERNTVGVIAGVMREVKVIYRDGDCTKREIKRGI